LLDDAGNVTASYGYSAYGGSDAPPSDTESLSSGDPDPQAPLNPYRYASRRMDSGTVPSGSPAVASGAGGYDMGARRFGPDLGAFLQQDQFYGALSDLGLALDPLTQNRYALAGGNPISYVEWDGHAPTQDNPVSANPTLNVQLNATNSTWTGKDRFVGCACAGLDQQVRAASSSSGSGGRFNPIRAWMGFYHGYVAQAQEELTGLSTTLGCGVAHLCSNAAYQQENAKARQLLSLSNPDMTVDQQFRVLLEGATRSIRQDWTSGHKAQAVGRVGWIGLSTIAAATGLGAAKRAGAEASGINTLSKADNYGIWPYRTLRADLAGTGLVAHHLIEQRFAAVMGQNAGDMASIAVTDAEHQAFTNAWRAAIPYGPRGTGMATRVQVEDAARQIYADYPDILKALGL
jgi:hypothetical protein